LYVQIFGLYWGAISGIPGLILVNILQEKEIYFRFPVCAVGMEYASKAVVFSKSRLWP
jgi:hypothetical protein